MSISPSSNGPSPALENHHHDQTLPLPNQQIGNHPLLAFPFGLMNLFPDPNNNNKNTPNGNLLPAEVGGPGSGVGGASSPSLAHLQFLEVLAQQAQLGQQLAWMSATSKVAAAPIDLLPPMQQQLNNNNNGIGPMMNPKNPNKLLSTLALPLNCSSLFMPDVVDPTITHASPPMTHAPTRRRRRAANAGAAGNMDNTLDGLVAKRTGGAGGAGAKRRYQTETEAIELPDDEAEIKRMEADPDVCTRMCSVCGYQGKWVSEMIRHKRVHTNERPFKCRYCNRTSKWKADLIRHVAKTHGIRVVSKYSRSKAFELGGHGHGSKSEPGQAEHFGEMEEDEEVVVLGGSASFSSASSDSGHSSGSIKDENSTKCQKTKHHHSAGGDSLNSYVRKAQRLSSIMRNNGNLLKQLEQHNQEQQAQQEQNPVLALNLMGTSTPSETAVRQDNPNQKLFSDAQLTLLQFLNIFPQLFPQLQSPMAPMIFGNAKN